MCVCLCGGVRGESDSRGEGINQEEVGGGVVGVSGRDKCGCGVKGPILVTCKWYTWRGCKKGLVLGPIR